MHDVAIRSQTSLRNFILIAGLLLYCGAFVVLSGNKSFDASGALVVLVVFAIVLPLIAWVTTRHAIPLSISIEPGISRVDCASRICGRGVALSDRRPPVD
jgi:hypothetical protein